jgi:hypothetical protein
MRSRCFAMLLLFGMATTTTLGGCYAHHHYDYASYHWSDAEEPYYEQWEHETHRDHVDWNQRNADDQRAYWQWRQDHH